MPKMLLATAFVLATVAALPSTVSAQAKPAAKSAAAAPKPAATTLAAETDAAKTASVQAAEEKRTRERDEAARKRAELEERCTIKPVMTDAEIDLCRKAGRR